MTVFYKHLALKGPKLIDNRSMRKLAGVDTRVALTCKLAISKVPTSLPQVLPIASHGGCPVGAYVIKERNLWMSDPWWSICAVTP